MTAFCCTFAIMNAIIKTISLAALLNFTGQQAAFSYTFLAGTTKPYKVVKADSIGAEVCKDTIPECCADTTDRKKEEPYAKLIKKGGSVREGLFTVRHIKDDWYLEVPD